MGPSVLADPSNVPNPSVAGGVQRIPASQAPTNMTAMPNAQATQAPTAKLSNLKNSDYCRGDIVNLPFHAPNTNKNLDPTNANLANTKAGFVYSKRRYAVVLWVTETQIFCVPIFTYQGRGVTSRPWKQRFEYICLRSYNDNNYINDGNYDPVVTKSGILSNKSCIHITAGFVMECKSDISMHGYLDKKSHDRLYDLWQKLTEDAKQKTHYADYL